MFFEKKISAPVIPVVSGPSSLHPAPIRSAPNITVIEMPANGVHPPPPQEKAFFPVCQLGVELLEKFHDRINLLSAEVAEADKDHKLAQYALGKALDLLLGPTLMPKLAPHCSDQV
jgi:hypothetical protein